MLAKANIMSLPFWRRIIPVSATVTNETTWFTPAFFCFLVGQNDENGGVVIN